MKMLNVVGLGPPGFAAREERSCFSWHTAAGGPGGTWKFVERPSSEAGLEAFVSSAMDAAVKEVSAPREDRIHVARHTSADYDAYFRAWRSTTDARAALEENFAELTNFCARHEPITELCRKGSVPDREDRDELDGQTLTGKAPRDLKRALGSFDPEQICAACGKWDAGGGAVALKRCANCRAIFYCSPACQKKNWKMHKKVCKQLKAEREAARVADGIGQLRV